MTPKTFKIFEDNGQTPPPPPRPPQIPIATSGIRAMGYMMRHHLRTEGGGAVSQRTINQFVKVLMPEGHLTSAWEEVVQQRSLSVSCPPNPNSLYANTLIKTLIQN